MGESDEYFQDCILILDAEFDNDPGLAFDHFELYKFVGEHMKPRDEFTKQYSREMSRVIDKAKDRGIQVVIKPKKGAE